MTAPLRTETRAMQLGQTSMKKQVFEVGGIKPVISRRFHRLGANQAPPHVCQYNRWYPPPPPESGGEARPPETAAGAGPGLILLYIIMFFKKSPDYLSRSVVCTNIV